MKNRIGILSTLCAIFCSAPDEGHGSTSAEIKVTTPPTPESDEPEKTVTETTTTEQAVSTEPGAPVIKTTEQKEHKE